ncbi:MAG: YdjY domain-containing protein [Planctomycetota bacterium]
MKVSLATLTATVLLSALYMALADDTQTDALRKQGVKVERLPDGRTRLGRVTIDARRRTIEFDGKVNMREGLVELLACTLDGKVHESVLVADVRPLHLQLALLTLGLNPGRNPGIPSDAGDKRKPGDMATIEVSWMEGEKRRTVRAEELIWHRPQQRAMERTEWVFLGSVIEEGGIAADATGSLITTYHDPTAILENLLPTVADDTLYFANSRVAPPVGTKVTVTITAVKMKDP